MTKVRNISVVNAKAVSKLNIALDGCTAIIMGGNNKGKSTALKSLPDRLRGIKPEAILKFEENEGHIIWELTTGEKFTWTFDKKKKEKLTYTSERNIVSSVIKDIATTYFPKVFDIDKFLNSTPKEQQKTLEKISNVDMTELKRAYTAAFDERTYWNKKLIEEKAKNEPIDPTLPLIEIDMEIDLLVTKLANLDNDNAEYERGKRALETAKQRVETIESQIKELQKQLAIQNGSINSIDKWLAHPDNKPKTEDDRKLIQSAIVEAKDKNRRIRENNIAIKQRDVVASTEKNAQAADEKVKQCERDKTEALEISDMPEGFGFSEDGITFEGMELTKEQLSSSKIYIAALKLAATQLTGNAVQTLFFDASHLDKFGLAEVESWASENDLQLLIERPDWEGGEIVVNLVNDSM